MNMGRSTRIRKWPSVVGVVAVSAVFMTACGSDSPANVAGPKLPMVMLSQNTPAIEPANEYAIALPRPTWNSASKLVLIQRYSSISSSMFMAGLLEAAGGSGNFGNIGVSDSAAIELVIAPANVPNRGNGEGDLAIGFVRFSNSRSAESARVEMQTQAHIHGRLNTAPSSGLWGVNGTTVPSGFDFTKGNILVIAYANCYGPITCGQVGKQIGESMYASMEIA
jgi:hypothetical protein